MERSPTRTPPRSRERSPGRPWWPRSRPGGGRRCAGPDTRRTHPMSEIPTLIDERHVRYITEHTTPEDAFLKDLNREAAAAGIPSIWIAPAQAAFMQILLRLGQAREVVEVGTLAGYSAIAMARALPRGGKVRTIELEAKHADFAERWIARSDVADRVEVLRGSGIEVLPRLGAGTADAAF